MSIQIRCSFFAAAIAASSLGISGCAVAQPKPDPLAPAATQPESTATQPESTATAPAENWVTVFEDDEAEMFAEVDVTSIRRGDDGLVYFSDRTDIGDHDRAVDCEAVILYMLSDGSWADPDWRANGSSIVAGSNGAMIADFVCSRAG